MFDAHGVSFVSVTQSFHTTTSMGRLTLNVLLSFAQFEREVTGERIRDKIAASKKKGIWMGGVVPLGYQAEGRALHIVEDHAELVRGLFKRYLEVGSVARLREILDAEDARLPIRIDGKGRSTGGGLFSRGHIYKIFCNPIYIGQIAHKGLVHEGQHSAIVDPALWDTVQRMLGENKSKSQRRDRQSANAAPVPRIPNISIRWRIPALARPAIRRAMSAPARSRDSPGRASIISPRPCWIFAMGRERTTIG
jgi:site-specific DNA recombinase